MPNLEFDVHSGIIYAICAYCLWGVFPIYFKMLATVTPLEIVAHRMVWSLVFLAVLLSLRRQWSWRAPLLKQPRVLAHFALSAALVGVNWLLYIWAVNHDHVLQSALGYFINPLVNVLLGFIILKERLRIAQSMAVALAALGVAWLTWYAGQVPWVGLGLAVSFAGYGLLRKTAALGALEGLTLETLFWFPLVMLYLVWSASQGSNVFVESATPLQLLLICAGPITTIPLLFFASAARRMPFSQLGLLQYIVPTMQLILGIWLYHEPFDAAMLIGYMAIWLALLLYSLEALWQGRQRRAASAAQQAA